MSEMVQMFARSKASVITAIACTLLTITYIVHLHREWAAANTNTFVETNPFGPAMLNVFNIAGIDYGRVDFGLVGGRPQIYEINSNPMVEPKPPASLMDRRNQSVALFRNNYLEAMEAIDTGRRPAWMRSTGSLVRSTRELPRRARRLAEGTYGKLKGVAARTSRDSISTGG